MRPPFDIRLAAAALAALSLLPAPRLAAQVAPGSAQGVRDVASVVAGALDQYESAGFAATRQRLQSLLVLCGSTPDGKACLSYVNYSLGWLHQREAAGGEPGDSLLRGSVEYYDQAIAANGENWAARYNKALVYREMGAHESQEDYFTEAAKLDPARRGTYLSLQGDYYLERQLPAAAARAYRDALAADASDAGARGGLIEAYRAMGASGLQPLFEQAEQWRMAGIEGSAEEAYAVLLEESIVASNRRLADTACIRLVALQQNITGPFLTRRPDIPSVRTWGPALQVDRFMTSPALDSVPWWRNGEERSQALARAALQRGIAAAGEGDAAAAARFFTAGLRLVEPRSAEAVDMQRELALLYTRHPSLDPDGVAFRSLENRIFETKAVVLASRDLEAAQRFHTTLALIYAERGAWAPGSPYRNVLDQVGLAFQATSSRATEQGFYQPLPELRALAARGHETTGNQRRAGDAALLAVRGWLDLDDVAAADSMLQAARRLGASGEAPDRLATLATLRSVVEAGGQRGDTAAQARAATACNAGPAAAVAGTGDAGFARRQRFKVLSDCVQVPASARKRELSLAALAAADTAGFTLQGAADVRRYQRALQVVLGAGRPDYVAGERARLAPAPQRGAASIPVAFRNQTAPRWLVLPTEDLSAVRAANRNAGPAGGRSVPVGLSAVAPDPADRTP